MKIEISVSLLIIVFLLGIILSAAIAITERQGFVDDMNARFEKECFTAKTGVKLNNSFNISIGDLSG